MTRGARVAEVADEVGLSRRHLAPTAVALDDPAVSVDPDGTRAVTLTVPGGPGERTRVWLATVTHDGIPSPLAGPYTLIVPV